jgi:hypothetical protein
MTRFLESEIDAMRVRSSTAEVLAKYDRGLITCEEVVSAAWLACWDHPESQEVLIRQFRAHSSELVPSSVGDGLAILSATAASQQDSQSREF